MYKALDKSSPVSPTFTRLVTAPGQGLGARDSELTQPGRQGGGHLAQPAGQRGPQAPAGGRRAQQQPGHNLEDWPNERSHKTYFSRVTSGTGRAEAGVR